MIDCSKCVHEDVCDQSSRQMWAAMSGESDCTDFKNRTEYVETRHGKWVYPQIGMAWNYICSECGWYRHNWVTKTNYCPNCGAKMDVEVEG